jgi:SAM-dependent methyltransferase
MPARRALKLSVPPLWLIGVCLFLPTVRACEKMESPASLLWGSPPFFSGLLAPYLVAQLLAIVVIVALARGRVTAWATRAVALFVVLSGASAVLLAVSGIDRRSVAAPRALRRRVHADDAAAGDVPGAHPHRRRRAQSWHRRLWLSRRLRRARRGARARAIIACVSLFDRDPVAYDAVRPSYPPALVDDVIALAQLSPGARVVEVGSGTGQATRLFVARGFAVTAVEAGPSLAAATRAHVPGAEVVNARFEEATLPRAFSLVYSATAWHWIDPAIGYARAHDVLVPGGTLALFWNEHVRGDDDVGFYDAVQDLYAAAGMERARLDRVHADRSPGIVASGLFDLVAHRGYPWHTEYDGRGYACLVGTYADHIQLPADVRTRLLDGIAALIDTRFGGRIKKHYVADLYVARARDIKRA